jgi:NADH-quinone oxidoreductase subunit J
MLTSLFYFLAFVTILFAVLVITSKNPVHSVLYLVLTFFCISAFYILLLDAPFVGIVNIIVYAGAIMVLFLFIIMMLNLNAEAEPQKSLWLKLAGAVSGGSLLVIMIAVLKQSAFSAPAQPDGKSAGSIQNLGKVLYTEYILPFEVASVLFLIAMVGAVVLGRKEKSVSPSESVES